ncbi:hypothetical protein BN961_01977 [Afipia felis]|uniref:Uncharacterized protein n=1 Tax=Afipia felis TaxID=1035 RepID=A0A090MMD9_AFIFE|nr:hypothetical protein BN961_01977 [Afipia felis]
MTQARKTEPVDVAFLLRRQRQREQRAARQQRAGRRRVVRIRLIAHAGLEEAGEAARLQLLVGVRQIGLDACARHRIEIGAGQRFLEIAFRHLVGAEPEIQCTQLILNPRQLRVVEQKPLQRADRRLIIGVGGGDAGIFKGDLMVRRVANHLLVKAILLGRVLRNGGSDTPQPCDNSHGKQSARSRHGIRPGPGFKISPKTHACWSPQPNDRFNNHKNFRNQTGGAGRETGFHPGVTEKPQILSYPVSATAQPRDTYAAPSG